MDKMIPEGLQKYPSPKEQPVKKVDEIANNNTIDDSVNWFDLIKEWTRQNLTNDILKSIQGGNMGEEVDFKKLVTGLIVRWILKVGSGALLALGISAGSATEILTAVVTFVIGMVISLVQNKTLLNSTPQSK